MLELFLNPYTMVAGGALVSSPVIIHLINRLRYRRVRWAAMEFLLKSQKRNRRRLIIEQLLLLLLRILLVLLAAFLLARFLGWAFGQSQGQSATHVVVLDDTLSMADHWREDDGRTLDALAAEKIKIDLVDAAHPYRTPTQRRVDHHNNLAVTDLRPETRVTAEGATVEFTVTVANYGSATLDNVQVTIRVDGK